MKLKYSCYDQPRQHIKKQRHYFANKGPCSQSYGFSSSHVWMWKLNHKESWAPKNWCFWTALLEKTLENPLDCKDIKPVNPKGNQSCIFIVSTDAEAEAPILWQPNARSRSTGLWCCEKLKAGGEEDDRGWEGWMALPTQWTWVWAGSGRWWRTGKPVVLQSMGLQRVGQDWATEQPRVIKRTETKSRLVIAMDFGEREVRSCFLKDREFHLYKMRKF